MKKRPVWAIIFGLLLAAFTAYLLLDMFVIRRTGQDNASEMNLSVFDGITPAVTPKPATETDADTKTDAGTEEEAGAETGENAGRAVSEPETEETEAPPTTTPTVFPENALTPIPLNGTDEGILQPEANFTEEEIITGNTWTNDHISLTLASYREHDTNLYVADIYVTSAEYIKTAFAEDTYGRNIFEKTSEIAESKNAVFAVNGDDYGAREGGYVIRNGVIYREVGNTNRETLSLLADGSFLITEYNEAYPNELLKKGAWQCWTFGPTLLKNGEIAVTATQEVDYAMAKNQRTVIGIIEPLHYVIIVSDGRTDESTGLSLYEIADFMKRYGVVTGYNLDGGGSSTMYFDGRIINCPTADGRKIKEREISDILYVG